MAATVVELYYDVLSPYSWVAFEVLCRYRQRWNIQLHFKPFLLGAIMAGSGNRAPGMVPLKAQYMGKDLERIAEYYKIPLKRPSNVAHVMFEKGSLRSQRLLTAAVSMCPEHLEELSRQLWLRIWSRDEDITTVDSLRSACLKAGLSGPLVDQLLTATEQQHIKDQLKATTQEALDLGAFGSPYIVAEVNEKKEIFFGSDRFELMAHVIGEKWSGPLPELSVKY